MDKREQIIEALEMSYRFSNVDENNTLVPQEIVLDIIALLKAQEPRLLTAEDFEANPMLDDDGRLPCWCEDMVDSDGWTAVSVGGVLPGHVKANGCRYWTSRPTDEQREAIPWER